MVTHRIIALGLGLACFIAACSATTSSEPTPAPPKPVCPDTVPDALSGSASCTQEGYLCGVGYQCGPFAQQAACTCTNKKWSCADTTGTAFNAGEDPATHCVPETQPPEKCPADVPTAQMACSKPKTTSCCATPGKACFYKPAPCDDAGTLPALSDNCTCEQVSNFDGAVPNLQWVCNLAVCGIN